MLSFLELIVDFISDLFPGASRRRWIGVLMMIVAILVLILIEVFSSAF